MTLRHLIRLVERRAKYGDVSAVDAAVLDELDRLEWTPADLERVIEYAQSKPGRVSELAKTVARMTDAELMEVIRRGRAAETGNVE